jgi:hypothetical protein
MPPSVVPWKVPAPSLRCTAIHLPVSVWPVSPTPIARWIVHVAMSRFTAAFSVA